jgi:hypothetical protein
VPFFLLAFFCEKGKNALAFWSFLFSLSRSLSIFFLPLVFRVSYKTLKLGAVKLSSVVVAFLYSSSHQAAKKQKEVHLSLIKFFKLEMSAKTEEEDEEKVLIFSHHHLLYIHKSSLQNRTQEYSFQREEEDECGRVVLRAYTLFL